MRFYGFAVAVGAIALGACAGGEKKPADTTHVAVDTTAASTTTTTGTSTTTSGAGTMAPITGTTHEVKMVGDAKGYRFDPVNITVKRPTQRRVRSSNHSGRCERAAGRQYGYRQNGRAVEQHEDECRGVSHGFLREHQARTVPVPLRAPPCVEHEGCHHRSVRAI